MISLYDFFFLLLIFCALALFDSVLFMFSFSSWLMPLVDVCVCVSVCRLNRFKFNTMLLRPKFKDCAQDIKMPVLMQIVVRRFASFFFFALFPRSFALLLFLVADVVFFSAALKLIYTEITIAITFFCPHFSLFFFCSLRNFHIDSPATCNVVSQIDDGRWMQSMTLHLVDDIMWCQNAISLTPNDANGTKSKKKQRKSDEKKKHVCEFLAKATVEHAHTQSLRIVARELFFSFAFFFSGKNNFSFLVQCRDCECETLKIGFIS